MSDIKKIQLLHHVKETFNVEQSQLDKLAEQIENSNFKDNLDRFFRGYKIEDLYSYVQGALPWVKLVHGLDQNQFPLVSKENYQVPDYLCIFEDGNENEYPVLVEVKSVKGDKKSLELMKRQVISIEQYSKCLGIPFIVAIYWAKYGLWTHVPIDVFENKTKKYKITLENAYRSDLSLIFGDICFVIDSPLFRKTTYGQTADIAPQHGDYGSVLKDQLSADGINYIEITHIESAVIDAVINMKVQSEEKVDSNTVVIESSSDNYVLRLSNLMLRHIGVFGAEPNFEYLDYSRRTIIELMKKLSIKISYPIPSVAKSHSKELYKKAFSGSFVLNNYNSVHSESDA